MKNRNIGVALGAFAGGDLQSRVNAVAAAGFRALEFASGIGRGGCIAIDGAEYPESEWGELAGVFASIEVLTLHAFGPSGPVGGFVCRKTRDNDFSMKVFETQVRFAAALGMKGVAFHDTNEQEMDLDPFLAASRENLKRMAGAAECCGVPIGVENPTYGSLELMREQVESVGSSLLGFTIDTGHMAGYIPVYDLPGDSDGLNQALARTLAALLPRCVDMHVHDVSLERGDHNCPGMGSLDWEMWADHVRRCGYAGPIQMEVSTFEDEDQLARARQRLDRLLSEE